MWMTDYLEELLEAQEELEPAEDVLEWSRNGQVWGKRSEPARSTPDPAPDSSQEQSGAMLSRERSQGWPAQVQSFSRAAPDETSGPAGPLSRPEAGGQEGRALQGDISDPIPGGGLAAEMVRLGRAVRSAGRRQEARADPVVGVWTPGRGMAGSAERRDPVLLVDAAIQRDARRYDGGFPLL